MSVVHVQVETIQFTTMLRLLEERVVMHPDSALVLQERAFEIIVQADNFLSGQDLSKHHDHLVGVCQDMLGGLCRYFTTHTLLYYSMYIMFAVPGLCCHLYPQSQRYHTTS